MLGRWIWILGAGLALFSLTGCQQKTDLEDRNFVMTLGVEAGKEKDFLFVFETADLASGGKDGVRKSAVHAYEADSLKEALDAQRSRSDKKLDFGHVKAIVFSKDLLPFAYGESWAECFFTEALGTSLLQELKGRQDLAGTILVFFTKNKVKNLIEQGAAFGTSFGEYAEKMVENQGIETKEQDTLAKLLRDFSEGIRERKAFFIEMEEEGLFFYEKVILKNNINQSTIKYQP